MFDYQVSKHPHYDEACRAFAKKHNMAKLTESMGMNIQTLRNKLNPGQPHQLTTREIWVLTDITEDSTLVDGFLAQIHCQPCVPINELAKDKLQTYVMFAMGELASGAISTERLTMARMRQWLRVLTQAFACCLFPHWHYRRVFTVVRQWLEWLIASATSARRLE